MVPLPFVRHSQTGRTVRNIVLLALLLTLLYASRTSVLAQYNWSNMYLLYATCNEATDPTQCLDYDVNGVAYAEKSGMCVDDTFMTGATPNLFMFAFGSCLPHYSVWNEAQVTGDFRDVGLDGYSTNTVLVLGTVVNRSNGGYYCDGWFDVWDTINAPCPP